MCYVLNDLISANLLYGLPMFSQPRLSHRLAPGPPRRPAFLLTPPEEVLDALMDPPSSS
jgi:hypothetical protein